VASADYGMNSYARAFLLEPSGSVLIGGSFSYLGLTALYRWQRKNLIRWAPASREWSTVRSGIASGLDVQVNAVAAAGGKLYFGSSSVFQPDDDTVALKAHAFDTATRQWSTLTSASSGSVGVCPFITNQQTCYATSVVVDPGSGDVYYGVYGISGAALQNGTSVNNLLRWSPAEAEMHPLPNAGGGVGIRVFGNYNGVNAAALWSPTGSTGGLRIYFGGQFVNYGGTVTGALGALAEWNGSLLSPVTAGAGPTCTGAVTGVTTSFSDVVNALAVGVLNGDKYLAVGGTFTKLGDGTTVVNRIVLLNADAGCWVALAVGANIGLAGSVNALAFADGLLYVGGAFTSATGGAANSLKFAATWDGSAWGMLGAGVPSNVYSMLPCPASMGGGVFLGGGFASMTGGPVVNSVVRWNTTGWETVPPGSPSVDGVAAAGVKSSLGTASSVYAMAVVDNYLYVAGYNVQQLGGAFALPEQATRGVMALRMW
jgi:hypothetical protein